jgi:CSLREA domain-containing protein
MTFTYKHPIVRHLIVGLSLLITCISSQAATFTVTTLDDVDGPCSPAFCTLRQAINAAEDETSNPGADARNLAKGLTGPQILKANCTTN